MLSTTLIHTCRRCGSERIFKNGHTTGGAQRVKCKDCAHTLILEPKGPRYSEEFKAQVLAAHQERVSLRGIKRAFGVCYQTVMAWAEEKSGAAARL